MVTLLFPATVFNLGVGLLSALTWRNAPGPALS
jgi:hypothetical protein